MVGTEPRGTGGDLPAHPPGPHAPAGSVTTSPGPAGLSAAPGPAGLSAPVPGEPEVDVFLSGLAFFDLVFAGFDQPPAPGTEVWARELGSGPGGIANFAVAVCRLGRTASLAAAFGEDLYGELCSRLLIREGVDLSRSHHFTGWGTPVTVALAYDGDRALVTNGRPPPLPPDELVGRPPVSRATIVHIGAEPVEWLGRSRDAGALVFADVGWDPSQVWTAGLLEQLATCHAFTPNAAEAMAYTRTDSPREALTKLADVVPLAVVTLGPEGVMAVDGSTDEAANVAGLPVDVVDTTGAGDVFGAALVVATLAGMPLAERLRFANLAAALSLRRPGGAAAAPSRADLALWWEDARHGDDDVRRDYGFLDDVLPRGNTSHPHPVLAGE
jgi:sugar/nucleoside kinase (ribokinase family)